MDRLSQIFLWSLGAILIVIGAIDLRRKQKKDWGFLLAGIVVYLLGCLML